MTKTTKQNPQLKERKLAGGRTALYLEYYDGRSQEPRLDEEGNQMYYPDGTAMAGKPMFIIKHLRHQESLDLYLVDKPRTQEDRDNNRATRELAQSIRNEREQERLKGAKGYRKESKTENLFTFFSAYLDEYTKKDIRNIQLAINRFKSFLRENPKYKCFASRKSIKDIESIKAKWESHYKTVPGSHRINENEFYSFAMPPRALDSVMVGKFRDYLISHSEGEGAATSFARFKKVITAAVAEGVLVTNPCENFKRPPVDSGALTKDILSTEEVKSLIACHYDGENPEIRKAFIFTLNTGIRFCDVKSLRFSNINYQEGRLTFTQAKTEGHSAHAEVSMPLRADLLQMIGTPEENGKTTNDLIFDLPSHTMCLKALKHWTSRAGINKHITWHCGRHSFATIILTNGANIRVVADLLGHSGLQHVTRYARAVDSAKQAAIDSLPSII